MAQYLHGGRQLAEGVAAPSPEPEGSDIVEVYSFNTGMHFKPKLCSEGSRSQLKAFGDASDWSHDFIGKGQAEHVGCITVRQLLCRWTCGSGIGFFDLVSDSCEAVLSQLQWGDSQGFWVDDLIIFHLQLSW